MARYIRFAGGNGYCGCDFDDLAAFDDDTTDRVIDEYGFELALDNAESLASAATGGEEFESEEEEQEYFDNCWYEWEEISLEEYERIRLEGF